MKYKSVSTTMKQTVLISFFLFLRLFQAVGDDVHFSFLRVDFSSDDPAMRKQGFCLSNRNERDTRDCYHWSVRINGKKIFTINDHYILGTSRTNPQRYFSFDDASANEIENAGLDLVSPIRRWNDSVQSMGSEPDRKAELMKLLEPYLPNMPKDVEQELREPGFGDGKGILYANVELLNPADEVVDRILITSLPIGVPRSYAVYCGKNEKAGFHFISNFGTGPEKADRFPASMLRVDHAEFDAEKGVFAIVHDIDYMPVREFPIPDFAGIQFELFRNPSDVTPYVVLTGRKLKMDSLDDATIEKLKTLAAENEGKEIRYHLLVTRNFQPPAQEREGTCVLKTGPLSKPTPRLWRDPYPATKEQRDQIIEYVKQAHVDLLEEACDGKDVDFNSIFDSYGWALLATALDHDLRADYNTLTSDDVNRTLEYLLNHHADPQIRNRSGYHAATRVLTLPYSSLELLLKYGLDPSYTDPDGETMLDKAIEFRAEDRAVDPRTVEALEKLCAKNLWSAVKVDSAEALRERLNDESERAKINEFDRKGNSPLFYAFRRGDLEIMRILLDAGADPMRTIFHHGKNQTAVLEYQQDIEPALAEYLKSPVKGATVTRKETSLFGTELSKLNYEEYLLMQRLNGRFVQAARDEDLATMKQCIEEGVDVNEAGGKSFNALRQAVLQNNPEMVRLLLENGADRIKFLLADAISLEENSYEVTRLLLDAGFSTELAIGSTVDMRERSCLFMALNRKKYDIAELLLQYGARTDVYYLEKVSLAEQLAEVPGKMITLAGGVTKGILMMPLGFILTAVGNDINPPHKHILLEEHFKNDKKAVELLKKIKTSGK